MLVSVFGLSLICDIDFDHRPKMQSCYIVPSSSSSSSSSSMAYNLESLLRILDDILHSHSKTTAWILDDNHKDQLESLFQKVSSLKHLLLESTSHKGSKQIGALESEIRDAAREGEDIIEPDMVDQMLSEPYAASLNISPANLRRVTEKFDMITAKLMKIKEQTHEKIDNAYSSSIDSNLLSYDPTSTAKQDTVVGFEDDILQLKERLTSQTRKLEILLIVGMGGIGKTTLARKLYDDPLVRSHFHARAWVTVSQDYSARAILFDLLRCIAGKLSQEMMEAKNNHLAVILHKMLYGQRYLIVVDDIWSGEAWDEIKHFFPNDSLRSRILLTTREHDVAIYADSSCELHQMHLLNNLQSWNLFQQKTFGKKSCPPSLEGIGRKIVGSCGGLPLAISVIGGLLSENKNSKDLWDQVARDVSSAAAEKDEHFSKIFSLSYDNLPDHLRPCFLYMAAFPEDYEVGASRLVSLWVAEGFLKGENPEESAEECLKALANRNLISVRQYKTNGEAKSYIIHDHLRKLCARKAHEEKFLRVVNHESEIFFQKTPFDYSLRRVSVHRSYQIGDFYASAEHMSLARTFLCTGLATHYILSPVFFALKLLRVLDVLRVKFPRFPLEVLRLVNLRFLALSADTDRLPSEISRLRNLQILIAEMTHKTFNIPSELWDIPELRQVKMKNSIILLDDGSYPGPQERLQALSHVYVSLLRDRRLLTKIPNIIKLGIYDVKRNVDLRHLHKLETLRCRGYTLTDHSPLQKLSEIEFPRSIKKLTLADCMIPQPFVSTIGSLPNLQVLRMRNCSFGEITDDAEWEVKEGGFESLQYLLLERVTLVRWKAAAAADDDSPPFPALKHLVIRDCGKLEGIPSSFEDIASLEKIEVDESSPALVASVRQFEEEQRYNGNLSLQILIDRR